MGSRRKGRALPEQSRCRNAEPVGMEAVWAMWKMGKRSAAAYSDMRRRYSVSPVAHREIECARPGYFSAEYRFHPSWFSECRQLDLLCPRKCQRESSCF